MHSIPRLSPRRRVAGAVIVAACSLTACSLTACSTETVPPAAIRHAGAKHLTLPPNSPAWVVDHFYAWTNFPELSTHTTGEFARRFEKIPPLGATLKPTVAVSAPRELLHTTTRAIYATTLTTKGRSSEWYTYLVRQDTTWKIEAVRTIEFKPIYYTLLDTLTTGWRFHDAPSSMRKTMALTVATDSAIRAYFVAHAADFTALAQSFQKSPALKLVDLADPAAVAARRGRPLQHDVTAPIRTQLERLAVSSIFRNPAFPNCAFIRIGGMGTSQVGYLYAPTGCPVPSMNPHSFIYVANIRPNWYAYKSL